MIAEHFPWQWKREPGGNREWHADQGKAMNVHAVQSAARSRRLGRSRRRLSALFDRCETY